jgi:hypothetical protein
MPFLQLEQTILQVPPDTQRVLLDVLAIDDL